MEQKKITLFVGARPNIPKAWTLQRALDGLAKQRKGIYVVVVHSGQHYDEHLGQKFADQLSVRIDLNLQVGSSDSDGNQLSALLSKCDVALDSTQPDCVIVIGDVNTTLAAAIVASRRGLPVIHLEAGLRSRTWEPEEINRRVITACSTYHLAPSAQTVNNLLAEGIAQEHIFFVGNSLVEAFVRREDCRQGSEILQKLGLSPTSYILFTVHKSVNLSQMDKVISLLTAVANMKRVVFPCHPHTLKLLRRSFNDVLSLPNVLITEPLPYDDFGRLLQSSYCVITDSAGVQDECSITDTPCMTIGLPTSRPETIMHGSNNFIGYNVDLCLRLLQGPFKSGSRSHFWDDQVSNRIETAMLQILQDIETTGNANRWVLRF